MIQFSFRWFKSSVQVLVQNQGTAVILLLMAINVGSLRRTMMANLQFSDSYEDEFANSPSHPDRMAADSGNVLPKHEDCLQPVPPGDRAKTDAPQESAGSDNKVASESAGQAEAPCGEAAPSPKSEGEVFLESDPNQTVPRKRPSSSGPALVKNSKKARKNPLEDEQEAAVDESVCWKRPAAAEASDVGDTAVVASTEGTAGVVLSLPTLKRPASSKKASTKPKSTSDAPGESSSKGDGEKTWCPKAEYSYTDKSGDWKVGVTNGIHSTPITNMKRMQQVTAFNFV